VYVCNCEDSSGADSRGKDTSGTSGDEDYLCNTMLLLGSQHGIGKTSMVYALAQELGFKVSSNYS